MRVLQEGGTMPIGVRLDPKTERTGGHSRSLLLTKRRARTRLRAAAGAVMVLGTVVVHAAASAADFTIVHKNRAFSVRQITVKVGDRITFVNDDSVNHHVFSDTKGSAMDILQRPGRSDTVRFSQPGTVEVECAIHPEMRLEVQVRP